MAFVVTTQVDPVVHPDTTATPVTVQLANVQEASGDSVSVTLSDGKD